MVAAGDDEKLGALISSLAVEPLDGAGDADYAESVWSRLQEAVLKAKSDAMRLQLQKLNPTTDPGYDELFTRARADRRGAPPPAAGHPKQRVIGVHAGGFVSVGSPRPSRCVHWVVVQQTPEESR